jgi:uncharacterized protein (TIGR02145 family)
MAEGTLQITISNQIVLAESITIASAGGLTLIDTIGGTLQLTATVLPINTTNKVVTWSVISGGSFASVNSSGLVTAIDDGVATIRAIATDGSGVSRTFLVTISNQGIFITNIIVSGDNGRTYILNTETTLQMIATVSPVDADDPTYNWSVSDGSGSATIDNNGLLTVVSAGTVIVMATASDTKGFVGELTITIFGASTGKLAPDGWHIPTNTEWTTLQTAVGGFFSGYKLKEAGFTHWSPPNTNADNSSEFAGLGNGFRHYSTGVFQYLKELGWMWSADEEDTLLANIAQLWYDSANFQIGVDLDKRYGLPVRCIKDDDVLGDGTMEDIDGNIYPTIKIGNQVWMMENLRVTHFNDGSDIPLVEDPVAWAALTEEAMCWYDNIAPS